MQDEGKRFRIITLALVGAFVALWLFFVPSWGDDIIYRHIPDTATSNIESDYWDQTGEHVTTLGDAFEGAYLHYRYINGRLINTIPFFMSILPGWIWPLLNGIAAAGMLYLIGLAASRLVPGEITSWLFALAALLLWKWLPWYDAMSCQVYFINYVWTCAAAVGFLILYMKGSKGNRPALILGALLAFFVGSAHEEYALCAIGGVIFWHLAARRLPHGYQWVWLITLLLATIVCIFSPSTLGRMGRTTFSGPSLYVNFMFLMSPVVTAVCFISAPHKSWRFFCEKGSVAWLAFALTGLAISMVWDINGRALWPFAAGMLVLDLALVQRLFSRRVKPQAGRTATWIILGVLSAWCVGVLLVQYHVGRVQQTILDEMELHPGEYVIAKKAPSRSMAPFWTFGMVKTWDCDSRAWEILAVAHSQMPPKRTALPAEWFKPLTATHPGLYGSRDMILSDHLFEGGRAVEAEDSEGIFDVKISCPPQPIIVVSASGDTLYCLSVETLWRRRRWR